MLSLQGDGNYKVYLVNYNISEEEKNCFLNGQNIDLNDKIIDADDSSTGGNSGSNTSTGGGTNSNNNDTNNTTEEDPNNPIGVLGDCPKGQIKNNDGVCVDKPCSGDPVLNPEVAPQKGASGVKGALYGCTRYGGGCTGSDGRDKNHNGIDIKNPYGSSIHAIYDGKVLANYYQKGKAGYVTRLRSELPNGNIIIYQYFHLQKENRLNTGYIFKAGDIIGYQGNSGNLKGAIAEGTVDSHVHIKMNLYDGTGDSSNYPENFKNNPVNPADYIHTEIDNQGNSTTSNCN